MPVRALPFIKQMRCDQFPKGFCRHDSALAGHERMSGRIAFLRVTRTTIMWLESAPSTEVRLGACAHTPTPTADPRIHAPPAPLLLAPGSLYRYGALADGAVRAAPAGRRQALTHDPPWERGNEERAADAKPAACLQPGQGDRAGPTRSSARAPTQASAPRLMRGNISAAAAVGSREASWGSPGARPGP